MSGKNPLGNGREPQSYEGLNVIVPLGGFQVIKGRRAPTTNDKKYPVTSMWIDTVGGTVYILTSSANNSATWTQFSNSGTLTSLTVTGATTLTGTTNINTSGSAVTTIGTGGTGATNIGNATGNTAVTGALVATGIIEGAGVLASADPGSGVAATNTFSSGASTTISTGVGSVKMSTANPGTNTGWLKCYLGTQVAWIPTWTTNAP